MEYDYLKYVRENQEECAELLKKWANTVVIDLGYVVSKDLKYEIFPKARKKPIYEIKDEIINILINENVCRYSDDTAKIFSRGIEFFELVKELKNRCGAQAKPAEED